MIILNIIALIITLALGCVIIGFALLGLIWFLKVREDEKTTLRDWKWR